MQNARHTDAAFDPPVEDHMLAKLHPPQARTYGVAGAAQERSLCESLTELIEIIDVPVGLSLSPLCHRMHGDIEQVCAGAAREQELWQCLLLSVNDAPGLTLHLGKHIASGYAAGLAFGNRLAQP